VTPQVRLALWTNGEVVLQDNGLPVQQKAVVLRLAVQDVQQPVHQFDQLEAEDLKRLVPFAVPVRV